MKKAFTLIELLVVIAIIAILAAILFPVFAQAKAAAKATVSLSNTKQIGLAMIMYIGDTDDTYPLRRMCIHTSPTTIYSWKQAINPYVKNQGLFQDPVNPAAKFLDDTSDDAILAFDGHMLIENSGQKPFARGYNMNNINFYLDGQWDAHQPCDDASQAGFYLNGLNQSQIEATASVASNFEGKWDWVDTGSYIDWQKMDGTHYLDDDGIQRASGWDWGGFKWSEKAMAITFMDGHAKRVAHSSICGIPDDQYTPFGWRRADIHNHAPGGDMGWLDTYCQTMPAEVR